MVLKTPQLKSTIAMLPDVKELFNQVRSDETCIGMSPRLPPAGVPATLLQVSRSDKDVAFSPTVENIHTGDYPLRMSFYIACRPDRLGELGTVVALLLGDESAAGLEKAGFVPVPAKNRSELCRVFGGK
jgi:phosphate transport system substrate-binding protein